MFIAKPFRFFGSMLLAILLTVPLGLLVQARYGIWATVLTYVVFLPTLVVLFGGFINTFDLWLRRTTRDPNWLMTDEGKGWLDSEEGKAWKNRQIVLKVESFFKIPNSLVHCLALDYSSHRGIGRGPIPSEVQSSKLRQLTWLVETAYNKL